MRLSSFEAFFHTKQTITSCSENVNNQIFGYPDSNLEALTNIESEMYTVQVTINFFVYKGS